MDKKKCEFCGEEIHINSRRCPFCAGIQRELTVQNEDDSKETPKQQESEAPEQSDSAVVQPEVNDGMVKEEQPEKYSVSPLPNNEYRKQEPPLSNALKVFLTIVASIFPGLGQIVGIISAIMFMSNDEDKDRRSFGKALLTASLAMFLVWGMCCIFIVLVTLGREMFNQIR